MQNHFFNIALYPYGEVTERALKRFGKGRQGLGRTGKTFPGKGVLAAPAPSTSFTGHYREQRFQKKRLEAALEFDLFFSSHPAFAANAPSRRRKRSGVIPAASDGTSFHGEFNFSQTPFQLLQSKERSNGHNCKKRFPFYLILPRDFSHFTTASSVAAASRWAVAPRKLKPS